jgi:lipopolysaccharide export system permease protein
VKRVERLIAAEMLGPFLFGVALFTALISTTTMLVRLAEWVVKGVPAATATELVMLLLPAIIVKTFAMSALLAALLAFGRLSNDSEITALRAAGASLFRIVKPVIYFSAIVAVLSFAINETAVPAASRRATALTVEVRKIIDKTGGGTPVFQTVRGKDGIAALVSAKDFSLIEESLYGVHIVSYSRQGEPGFILFADKLRFAGLKDWRIEGKARLISFDGKVVADLKGGVWPSQIEKPDFGPMNLLASFAGDLDVFSMKETMTEIARLKVDEAANKRQIANLEFGLYNKIALPLAVVVFALLGAPLGIRQHRVGVGGGFALAVALSFAYLMLANFMAVYSKSGVLSPMIASFTPLALGLFAAAVTIYKKNG